MSIRISCFFLKFFIYCYLQNKYLHYLFNQAPREIIKSFDISYSDLLEIYIMNTQMLEVIDYIKNVNKKKVTVDKIVTWLNNAAPSNWDKESVEANLKEMQTKMQTKNIIVIRFSRFLHHTG